MMAVGVFLSVIAISSKQLVSYMKNVWKIRGSVESLQLADRRFVLEFSREGDFDHVTKGGPWRYQGDGVLIRKLEDKDDPNTVRFESMPIWAQFKNIPSYLLSKEMARKLGKKLGGFVCIDNFARGDIGDKILRARVLLPVARALQRWITMEDEFNGEEVVADVLYERLPSYCLCCGVIGHLDDSCDLPAAIKRRRYAKNLGVPPTHPDDDRKWYLPETVFTNGRALQMDAPWRNVASFGARRANEPEEQLALVANVAKEVEKLTVQEGAENIGGPKISVTEDNTKIVTTTATPTTDDNTKNDIDNNKIVSNTTTDSNDTVAATPPPKKQWKRIARGEGGVPSTGKLEQDSVDAAAAKQLTKNKDQSSLAPAVGGGGSVLSKRKEPAVLVQYNKASLTERKKKKGEDAGTEAAASDGDPRKDGGKEAASPGATGILTGASDSACQQP